MAFRYPSLTLIIALHVSGFRYHELYLNVMGTSLTFSPIYNGLLKWAAAQPVPVLECGTWGFYCAAPGQTCHATPFSGRQHGDQCVPCGMPAFEVMQASIFVAEFLLYMFTWQTVRARPLHIQFVLGYLLLVVWASLYFGFSSPAQCIGGVVAGVAYGVGWHLFTFQYVYPKFDWLLRCGPLTYVGYQDTLCRVDTVVPGDPVIVRY